MAASTLALLLLFACADEPSGTPPDEVLDLQLVSGHQQKAKAGGRLAEPIRVRVTSDGSPAAGRQVSFHVLSGGGTVASGTSTTDVDGIAQEWWTLGQTPGPHTLEARLLHPVSRNPLKTVSIQAVAEVDAPPVSITRECESGRPAWIWCDDFEQDRTASYFEFDPENGSLARVAAVGIEGSSGMRTRFAAGQVSAGSLKVAFGRTPAAYFRAVDTGARRHTDVYWRMYLRHEPGWTGGGGYKLSRATSLASASWAQAMIAHVWADPPAENVLVLDPASGTDPQGNVVTTKYNDFPNLRWLGAKRGTTRIFDSGRLGQWYCVEARVRLNDPGQANGSFQLWIDSQLEAEASDLNWVGGYTGFGINAVFLENYWNGGAPKAQERYFDNFVVSTERIGCFGVTNPPPPAPVASISIDPGPATVAAGSTLQLNAVLKDASGTTLSGRAVAWSSNNIAVATVGATTGLVTGVGPGSATITATSEGKSGTATVAVTGPPTGSSNEPAGMTRITDRPFNTKARTNTDLGDANCVGGSECWDREESTSAWTIVDDATAPAPGGRVAQQRYARGFRGEASPQGLAQKPWPMNLQYRTIYHRFWLKLSDNFVGHLTSTNKIFHIWTQPGNVLFYSAEGRGSRGPLQFQIRLQGVPEPDTNPFRQNGPNVPGRTGTLITRGKWHLFEVLLTLNTPGQKNGAFRVWQDGTLTHDYTGREILAASVTQPYWWQVQWSPTWGGSGDTVPEDMYMWIDQVYISGAK